MHWLEVACLIVAPATLGVLIFGFLFKTTNPGSIRRQLANIGAEIGPGRRTRHSIRRS